MKLLDIIKTKGMPMDQFNAIMMAVGEIKGTLAAVVDTQDKQRLDMHSGFQNLDIKQDKLNEAFITEKALREAENKAANLRMDAMEPTVEKVKLGLGILGIVCAAITVILTWAELVHPWLVAERRDVINSPYVLEKETTNHHVKILP